MNIELDEVVGQDVSDEALEMAAGGAQGAYPDRVHHSNSMSQRHPAERGTEYQNL